MSSEGAVSDLTVRQTLFQICWSKRITYLGKPSSNKISFCLEFFWMTLTTPPPVFSRPGQSQGLLYKHLCHSFISSLTDWLILYLKKSLRRHHAQTIRYGASSHKTKYIDIFKREYISWRASQLLYWFKSYGGFAERVDFAYWWSCIWRVCACLQTG